MPVILIEAGVGYRYILTHSHRIPSPPPHFIITSIPVKKRMANDSRLAGPDFVAVFGFGDYGVETWFCETGSEADHFVESGVGGVLGYMGVDVGC